MLCAVASSGKEQSSKGHERVYSNVTYLERPPPLANGHASLRRLQVLALKY